MSNCLSRIKKAKKAKELNCSTSYTDKMLSLFSASEEDIDAFFENDFNEELYLKSIDLNRKKKSKEKENIRKGVKREVLYAREDMQRIPRILSDKQKAYKKRLNNYCLDLLKKKNLYYLRKPFMVLFGDDLNLHGMSKKKIMQAFYTQERTTIKEVLESYLNKYSIYYKPYKKDDSKERVRRFREKKLKFKKGEQDEIKSDI